MLLARIQRDLFDFTDSESIEDFGPLLNFWYRANTPALSAALTAHPGLKIIVDATSVRSFEYLLKRLFFLADTVVLRDLRGQAPDEEAVRDYLIPDSGYRPGYLDDAADDLKALRPSPMTVLKPNPYWSSTEKAISSGTAHYAVEMGGGTPQELVSWLGKQGRPHVKAGRVVYAPFIPAREMEFEFLKKGVDLPATFGAMPGFHLDHDWLSASNCDTLFSLRMPFLDPLDLDTMSKVKGDYFDEFATSSRSILKSIRSIKCSIGTEQFASEVRDIQCELDASVRSVEKAIKRVRSLRSLRKMGVGVGLLGLSVAAFLGAPPIAIASGLTVAGVKFVADMISRLREEGVLRDMDHYFLWKLEQEPK